MRTGKYALYFAYAIRFRFRRLQNCIKKKKNWTTSRFDLILHMANSLHHIWHDHKSNATHTQSQRAENQIFTNSKTAHSEFWFEVSHNPSLTEGRRPKNNTTTPHTHTHKCVALWVFYLQTCICVGGFEKYFVSAFSWTGRAFPWSVAKPPLQNTVSFVYTQAWCMRVLKAWKLTLCRLNVL